MSKEELTNNQKFLVNNEIISENEGLFKPLQKTKTEKAFISKTFCETKNTNCADSNYERLNEEPDNAETMFLVQSNLVLNGLDGVSRYWARCILEEIEKSNQNLRRHILKGLHGLSRCWAKGLLESIEESIFYNVDQEAQVDSSYDIDEEFENLRYTSEFSDLSSNELESLNETNEKAVMRLHKIVNDSASDWTWDVESFSSQSFADEPDENHNESEGDIHDETYCSDDWNWVSDDKPHDIQDRMKSFKHTVDNHHDNNTSIIDNSDKLINCESKAENLYCTKENREEVFMNSLSNTENSVKSPSKTRKRSSVDSLVTFFNRCNASKSPTNKKVSSKKKVKAVDQSTNKTNKVDNNSIDNKKAKSCACNILINPKGEIINFKPFYGEKMNLKTASSPSKVYNNKPSLKDPVVVRSDKNDVPSKRACTSDSINIEDPVEVLLNVVQGRSREWVECFINQSKKLLKMFKMHNKTKCCNDFNALKNNLPDNSLENGNKTEKVLNNPKNFNEVSMISKNRTFDSDNVFVTNLPESTNFNEMRRKILIQTNVRAFRFDDQSKCKDFGNSHSNTLNESKTQCRKNNNKYTSGLDEQQCVTTPNSRLQLKKSSPKLTKLSEENSKIINDAKTLDNVDFSNKADSTKSIIFL